MKTGTIATADARMVESVWTMENVRVQSFTVEISVRRNSIVTVKMAGSVLTAGANVRRDITAKNVRRNVTVRMADSACSLEPANVKLVSLETNAKKSVAARMAGLV